MVKRSSHSTLKPKKKQKRGGMNEEILSDPSDNELLEQNDDFFEAEETAEDTKLRLAKELINKAAEVAKEIPSESQDAVGKLLEDASVSSLFSKSKREDLAFQLQTVY